MKTPSLLLLAGLLPGLAFADRLPVPTGAPPSYQAECGSCHLAFPPALLAASEWRQVMNQLDKHYGDNARLDEKTRREITAFLERNAGEDRRLGATAGAPPRLTETAWFRREHRKVRESLWKDSRVRGAANCAACHPGAERGDYNEHDLSLPELRRRKEH